MTSAIVVTHGNLAAELIATARDIYGDVSHCHAVTNHQKSPQALREELDGIVAKGGPDARFIVFVDFFGGSCCHTSVGLEMEHDNVRLISGVNLPMLLAFLNKRVDVSFESLPGELLARGHDSIQLVSADDD